MVGSNTTAFTDTGLNCGQFYYYRVMAYNRFGNSPLSNILSIGTENCYPVSNTATSTPTGTLTLTNVPQEDPDPIALTPGKYDDTNNNLNYQGTWNIFSGRELYNQTGHFSEVIGSSVSANFIGTRLEIVYTAYSNRGVAEIYIDDQLLVNLNQYSPSTEWQTVWVSPQLQQGNHTFQIIHSEGKLIDIDAVVVSNEIPKPTNTPSKTASLTPSPSMTLTTTETSTRTSTPTKTQTATQTGTTTKTNTPDTSGEDTKTPTSSPSPSQSATATQTLTQTHTYTPTGSSTPTLTKTITHTPSQSPTSSRTVTLTSTSTLTFIPSPSPSPTITYTKTVNSTPLQAGIYDDTHPSIYYQNNWNTMSARQLYNQSAHFSTGFGNSASFTFTGAQITLYYTAFSNKGKADIYIDGNFIAQLDQYSPAIHWQTKWDSPLLTPGVHEFTLIHTEGTMIDIDAIEVLAEVSKTPTPTLTNTQTKTATPSVSPTLSVTPTRTITLTQTPTFTNTTTLTFTATVSQTVFSQTPTFTATPTHTSTPSRTFTTSPTATHTSTFTPTSENQGLVENDEWVNASPIELAENTFSDSLNIEDASSNPNDPVLSCLGSTGYNSVWYSFSPLITGKLILSSESSEFNSALAVWVKNGNDLEALSCNDQALEQPENIHAITETPLLPGNTYIIEVVSPDESPSGVNESQCSI